MQKQERITAETCTMGWDPDQAMASAMEMLGKLHAKSTWWKDSHPDHEQAPKCINHLNEGTLF